MTVAQLPQDAHAHSSITPECYEDMRRLAAEYLRGERTDHTLQATALVHEALLRLLKYGEVPLSNNARVVGFAARAMRRILVDYGVARRRMKRGGPDAIRLPLDEALDLCEGIKLDLSIVDEALHELELIDSRQAQIVEMRFFAGLTEQEIADELGLSRTTVKRDWATAKIWLRAFLDSSQ